MVELARRQLLLILIGVIALATMAVGIYGLVRQPDAESERPRDGASLPGQPVEFTPMPAQAMDPPSLPPTADPVAYARSVAIAIFEWDTTSGFLPTDYSAAVLADADPTGEETPGLLTDVGTYLPTVEQWLDLTTMGVSQSLDIEEAAIPESWSATLEQARGQLRPGTTAVTVTGIRHRRGTWDGEPAHVSYPVSFTVFVACPPAFERCHVLRLSQLDNPLR